MGLKVNANTVDAKFLFLFRSALFVGIGSVVATIIYLTPIPDQFPQDCRRRCHELDWPMICRIKFYVEEIPCFSHDCPNNNVMVNRQISGPTIQVCENDIILVDVTNRLSGRSFSVHWRGQTLRETPHMDGVSQVTQCPILPHTTFQYKFRASEAGTHMWQISPGLGNLFGAFIVKQSNAREVHRNLFDTDDHVITIRANKQLLATVDGKAEFSSAANITAGVRHRFRALFGGRPVLCRAKISLEKLPLKIIAFDGLPVEPLITTSVEIAFGERVDFVLEAIEVDEPHLLKFEPINCENLEASVITLNVLSSANSIKPEMSNEIISTNYMPATYRLQGTAYRVPVFVPAPCESFNKRLPFDLPRSPFKPIVVVVHVLEPSAETTTLVIVRTTVESSCGTEFTCLNDFEGITHIPPQLNSTDLDNTVFLFFGVRRLFDNHNATILAPVNDGTLGAPHINNKTMILPSSPLMTQMYDIDRGLFCDKPCVDGLVCECLHLVNIPLGETVELLLIHQGGGLGQHVFHLHGHNFYVVGARQFDALISTEEMLEKNGDFVPRNLTKPVRKDTLSIPERGVVAVRFIADNPGYWLLDQELSLRGMQVIFHVGADADLPETPKDYPRCGSWVGPEFFLA